MAQKPATKPKRKVQKPPASVPEAVTSGEKTGILQALQRRLAAQIEEAEGAPLAALTRELRMITLELAPASQEASVVDEIAARRATRRAKAKDQ